jgi:hypothetical protein
MAPLIELLDASAVLPLSVIRAHQSQAYSPTQKKGPVAGAFGRLFVSFLRTPHYFFFLAAAFFFGAAFFLVAFFIGDSPIEICDLKKIAA